MRKGWGIVLDLDLNIHAGGEVELHQRVHRLRGRLHDVQQAAMRPDLELLTAFLVDVRGAIDRESLDMGRQRDRSANPGTRPLGRVHDLLRAVVEHAVIVGPKADAVLGWVTLAVAVLGFGLILLGFAREVRALLRLRGVDRLRRDLAGSDAQTRIRAARHWLGEVDGGAALLPPLAALNDPDAIVPLLRAGIEAGLRARADALGRRAALQVVAGMAATPAPSLVVLLVSWRGLRLVRQVASLYGLRPGVLGTLSLLRRTALAAGATAVTEVAMNTAAHAVLSTPLLAHLAGEMAGGAVAARRMVVLARATAVACTPLPQA